MTALAVQSPALVAPAADAVTPLGRAMAPLTATSHLRPAIARLGRGRGWPLGDVRDVMEAETRLHALPNADALDSAETALREVVQAPTEPRTLVPIIALLVDAFPHARPGNPVQLAALYADILADDEMEHPFAGFAPAVVAAAVRDLLKTSKFLPVPAEVHAACVRQRWAVYERWREARHLQALRADAERVLRLARDAAASDDWDDTPAPHPPIEGAAPRPPAGAGGAVTSAERGAR